MKINANEDFRRNFRLTFEDDNDGTEEPGTGVSFSARWAISKTGVSLGVAVTVTEYPGDPGRYRITADQADMMGLLPTYKRKTAYLILSVAGDIDCVWRKFVIDDNREAA